MAADCKSAALCATEVRILPCAPHLFPGAARNFPFRSGLIPMDMSPAGTGRMVVALTLIGLLVLAAWWTMEPGKYRSLTLVLLAFFAVRVVLGRLRSR